LKLILPWFVAIGAKKLGGTSRLYTRPESPRCRSVGRASQAIRLISRSKFEINASTCTRSGRRAFTSANLALSSVPRAACRRTPRNSLSNRSLSASPLLECELRASLRIRPARHVDRSSPTDTTQIDARCINSSPLSADSVRCQAHFFVTFPSPHFVLRKHLQKSSRGVPRNAFSFSVLVT
jgi:hypothetical protein